MQQIKLTTAFLSRPYGTHIIVGQDEWRWVLNNANTIGTIVLWNRCKVRKDLGYFRHRQHDLIVVEHLSYWCFVFVQEEWIRRWRLRCVLYWCSLNFDNLDFLDGRLSRRSTNRLKSRSIRCLSKSKADHYLLWMPSILEKQKFAEDEWNLQAQ